jgi:GxxExxY protein
MNIPFQYRGTETQREYLHEDLTREIIAAAIEVHRALGPGLLESAYEECLCHELHLRNIAFRRQVDLPVKYKNVHLDCGYRLDLVVDEKVVVELKAMEGIQPVHEAQLLTYLRLSGLRVGLLLNFGAPALRRGGIIRRIV